MSNKDQIKALSEQVAALTALVSGVVQTQQSMAVGNGPDDRDDWIEELDEAATFTTKRSKVDIYDEANEAAEIKSEREQSKRIASEANDAAMILLPLILQERDFQVLRWMMEGTQANYGQAVQQIIRGHLAKQRAAFREAQGGGGASSTNSAALAERLAPR